MPPSVAGAPIMPSVILCLLMCSTKYTTQSIFSVLSVVQSIDVLSLLQSAVSDERTVSLRPVTLNSSGSYKCEVSADKPSFHTVSKTANMLVVGEYQLKLFSKQVDDCI